jgi:SsrA-binding protein
MTPAPSPRKLVCQNRKARHLYHIEETFEAGLALLGAEVKSLRKGRGSLVESFAHPAGSELYIHGFHIPPYEQATHETIDPVRPRKLLLHRREIDRLIGAVSRKGYTIVPLNVYFKDGRAKMEIGLGRGKKEYDKREDIKKRDQEREMRRATSQDRKR